MKKSALAVFLLTTIFFAGCEMPNMQKPAEDDQATVVPVSTYDLPQAEIDALKAAFNTKYAALATDGKEVQTSITLEKQMEDFARGTVLVGTPGSATTVNRFLAAKKDGAWTIAFEGTGDFTCTEVASFNFPVDMVVDCVSENTIAPVDMPVETPDAE